MTVRPAAATGSITLPDRVAILTCIGRGAMGREERCDGNCSEHKLVLVSAFDYDELLSAAHAARARAATGWASPATVTGWWCARCGNVDLPQPCIGVCVWRPADWVNLALYERSSHSPSQAYAPRGR